MDSNFWELVATCLATIVAALAGVIAKSAAATAERIQANQDELASRINLVEVDVAYIKGRCDSNCGFSDRE